MSIYIVIDLRPLFFFYFLSALDSVDFGGRLFDHFLVNTLAYAKPIKVLNDLIKRFAPSKIPRSHSHAYFSCFALHFRTWLLQVGGSSFFRFKFEKTMWLVLRGASRQTIDSLSQQDSSIVGIRSFDTHRANLVAGLLMQRK